MKHNYTYSLKISERRHNKRTLLNLNGKALPCRACGPAQQFCCARTPPPRPTASGRTAAEGSPPSAAASSSSSAAPPPASTSPVAVSSLAAKFRLIISQFRIRATHIFSVKTLHKSCGIHTTLMGSRNLFQTILHFSVYSNPCVPPKPMTNSLKLLPLAPSGCWSTLSSASSSRSWKAWSATSCRSSCRTAARTPSPRPSTASPRTSPGSTSASFYRRRRRR